MVAKIVVHGPWSGPGEQETAVYLRDHLDDGWTLVCGRQLVAGSGTRDSDFILVGPNSVIVVEEKSWRVDLIGTEERWYERRTGLERGNPINQAVGVARILAGSLTRFNKPLASALRHAAPPGQKQLHLVHPLVVLSSPEVTFQIEDPRAASHVVRLAGCEQRLLEIDRAVGARFDLAPFRAAVLSAVTGLRPRPQTPTTLGAYTIIGNIEPTPRGRRYVGRHSAGAVRVLLTYERQGLTEAELKASDQLILREFDALQRLAHLRRVFAVDPYFGVNDDQMWVAPMHPPGPRQETLRRRIRAGRQPSAATFAAVAADAFAGLADIHDEGITHRALHPSRVWVTPETNGVMFSDFLIAKIADARTVHDADEVDHDGGPYRAPECRRTAHLAINPSDVYSLALCLLDWWELRQADPPREPQAPPSLPDRVRDVLDACFASAPQDRPSAREVADRLGAHLAEERKRAVRLAPGVRVGKYELVRQLGDGATATTWLMIDRAFDVQHTLKIMKSAELMDNLRGEFTLLHKLKHDRIVRIHDYLLEPPGPALISEYVEGRTVGQLAERLRGNPAAARRILADILDALEYAHGHGVLHRDLSPGNIIVDEDDRATLIDFGVASRADTDAHSMVGTLPYLAPEIVADGAWSPAADLYSLAVLVFEALVGRPPYAVDGQQRNKFQLVPPTPQEATEAGVGGTRFLEVLARASDPDPANRFPSAAELRDAIDVVFAPPPPPPDPPVVDPIVVMRPDPAPRPKPPANPVPRGLVVNPAVDEIRQLFRNSRLGNRGNRGLDSEFADQTYIETRLDERLAPRIIDGRPTLVVFSGNPGDGKTAFLERLGVALRERGAHVLESDAAGWRMALDGHEFASVYDASESHEGVSADELLRRALDPLNETSRAGRYTALIAANDGRLLDFLDHEAHRYPQIAAVLGDGVAGPGTDTAGVLRIDLKGRSMASAGQATGSLTVRMLNGLLTDDLWAPCGSCAVEQRCPIRANARGLGDERAQDRLHRLVLTSHLRRGRRPTIRDLRSALAYLVTVDLGCAEIHAEFGDGLGNPARPERHFSMAAFDAAAGHDRLLDEWRALDPAAVPAPQVERSLAPGTRSAAEVVRAKRLRYFTATDAELAAVDHLGPYRHLDEFRALLAGTHSANGAAPDGVADAMVPRLLRGLSRCVGPVGYDGDGVAVSVGEPTENGGEVVKVLPLDEFEVVVEPVDDRFVETAPDVVMLRHRSGQVDLPVDVDLFELLMRANAGFLPTNPEVAPLREELGLFRAGLTLQPASRVIIIEPNGRRNIINVTGTTIELLRDAR
ncbi:Serine/threonine protein kinase [Parafrankia irregularis]|uniref:non-specific serine/threonine protein kinase n=1 Tax=Parafrankia irregularis TaxID=795642 RepID=A0A0S4QSI8_9ACTN|nr:MULTISPECIES: protein kinase [Parafrankia]MBE3199891.1 protein kinase [Parafrankia sp. CH37]CUU58046.1 Serine/threonine protein kinase [Parafrankia irregularis]